MTWTRNETTNTVLFVRDRVGQDIKRGKIIVASAARTFLQPRPHKQISLVVPDWIKILTLDKFMSIQRPGPLVS